jgi:hypothetical protein
MVWVTLFDHDAPEGHEAGPEFELSALPDVGDRLALHSHEGDVAVFEVLGRTFEVAFDEQGAAVEGDRITLEVTRLQAAPDDDEDEDGEDEAPEVAH